MGGGGGGGGGEAVLEIMIQCIIAITTSCRKSLSPIHATENRTMSLFLPLVYSKLTTASLFCYHESDQLLLQAWLILYCIGIGKVSVGIH